MRSQHETLNLALSFHRKGQREQAGSLYRKVLKKDPNHPDALHLLGMLSIQEGNNEEAVNLIRKAIRNNKQAPQYYTNLAVALQNLGRNEEAASVCYQAISLKPDNFSAYNTLGNALSGLGNFDQAIESFRKALVLSPDIAEIHLNLGKALKEQGRLGDAEDAFRKAISLKADCAEAYFNLGVLRRLRGAAEDAVKNLLRAVETNPGYAEAYNILGNVLFEQEKADAAVACYQRALQIRPHYVEAHYNLGNLLAKEEKLDEAVDHYQCALKAKPDFIEALCRTGDAFLRQEKLSEAAEYFRRALKIRPDLAEAYNGLGNVLRGQGKPEEAIETYHKALIIKPDFAELHYNISNALFDLGRLDEAVESCHRALSVKPDFAEAQWNIGLALLTEGNYAHGWRKYEWRVMKQGESPAPFSYPIWDGSSLKGKTLLVYAEQGIGDEIMFASCLPHVVGEAGLCIVECDRRLMPLFSRSFPEAKFIPRTGKDDHPSPDLPHIDVQVAIGSLPLFLRPDQSSFPRQKEYLSADAREIEKWRDRLDTLGAGLKVGISWRGGKGYVRRIRSTTLEQWAVLFSIPGIHFINLQYGECGRELQEIKEKMGITIHDWEDADPLNDLDAFAAKISALALVISVDNSTVHIAGALGVPVWTLLSFVGEWRWLRDVEDTPWYKTVRLIRQTSPGDWDYVFRRASSDLRYYLDTGVKPEITCSYKDTVPAKKMADEPDAPFLSFSSEKAYRCAVITPIGPGHESLYEECLASIEKSFNEKKGNFSEVIPINIDDHDGKLGRSRARNLGIRKAAEHGVDWIFFLDADDLMAPSSFEYVSPYLEKYDGVWGSIWTIEKGETAPRQRPKQLPFLYNIQDVLSCDPFMTLQMGHFVRTHVALSNLFDESIDTGEDFDYYLRVWGKHRCIKTSLPFFYNRRGLHAQGPKSASGGEWHNKVEELIRHHADIYLLPNE